MTQRHQDKTGYTPSQLTVSVPGGEHKRVSGYESAEDVGRATSDPRYGKNSPRYDPDYTAEVQARMQISPCLDIGFTKDIPNGQYGGEVR